MGCCGNKGGKSVSCAILINEANNSEDLSTQTVILAEELSKGNPYSLLKLLHCADPDQTNRAFAKVFKQAGIEKDQLDDDDIEFLN